MAVVVSSGRSYVIIESQAILTSTEGQLQRMLNGIHEIVRDIGTGMSINNEELKVMRISSQIGQVNIIVGGMQLLVSSVITIKCLNVSIVLCLVHSIV